MSNSTDGRVTVAKELTNDKLTEYIESLPNKGSLLQFFGIAQPARTLRFLSGDKAAPTTDRQLAYLTYLGRRVQISTLLTHQRPAAPG